MRSLFTLSATSGARSFAQRIYRSVMLKALSLQQVTQVNVRTLNGGTHRIIVESNSDKNAVMQAFVNREFELPTSSLQGQWIAKAAQARTLIIDAGANIGATCIQFAMSYPNSIVVAIEPDAGNFALLRRNTVGLQNVTCLRAALGKDDGTPVCVRLPEEGTNDSFRVTESTDGLSEVLTISVDKIVRTYSDRRPFILKVDIEGYESQVFSGDCESINSFELIFLEPHDWLLPGESTTQSFIQFLAKNSRDLLIVGDKLASVKRNASHVKLKTRILET